MKRDTFLSSFWAVGTNRCLREWFKENYLLRVAFFFFLVLHYSCSNPGTSHTSFYNNICNYQTLFDTCTNVGCSLPTFQNVAAASYTNDLLKKFLQVKVHQISIHFKLHNILNSNLLNIHILTWLNKSHIPKIITTIWVPNKLYFP